MYVPASPPPAGSKSIVIDGRIIFRPQCRGIARSVIGLVEQFPTSAADGRVKMLIAGGGETPFDLDAVATRAELVETDLPVVAVHRVAALRRLLRQLGAGVLFTPYHPFTPLAAPCPVVSAVHDCIWEENPVFAGGRPRQVAFMALSQLSLMRASALVVPSLATAAAVRLHYPHVPVPNVVPNGVTWPHMDGPGMNGADVTRVRAELDLPGRYLLNVGARRPHKNQRLLVDAIARLDPGVSLVIVGRPDPRMSDDIDAHARALGVQSRVRTIASVSERQLHALYRGAAAFVFPSLVEGYGIPPLEAMVAGVPVIASAVPAVAEVCADAALLVSPHDVDAWVHAVKTVLDDRDVAEHLVGRGSQVARGATWQRGGALLYQLLASVATRS